MGDGGNYFLSFLIGITFIHLSLNKFCDDVFVAMSIPGYDMIIFVRIFNKKSFYGDGTIYIIYFEKK